MSVHKDLQTKTWYVQAWYKDFAGRRKHTTKRGFATKKDAERWEREFISGDHPENITVGELAKKFFVDVAARVTAGSLRATTAYHKEESYNNMVKQYFEKTNAREITTRDINEWLVTLVTKHETHFKDKTRRLSSGTIKNGKQVLSQIFDFGIANYGLTNNPVNNASDLSFTTHDTRVMWTKEQFILFRNTLFDKPAVCMLFDIIFASGLRMSEVLGLTPADIEPYHLVIVKGAVRLPKHGTIINPPKTRSSERHVEIPRSLYFAIRDFIKTIPDIKDTDRIFPFTASYAGQVMRNAEKEQKLPHTSPHMLRHLYASMIYAGSQGDLNIVAKQLGHSSIDVSAKMYVELLHGRNREAVDRMEKLFTIK